MSFLWTWFLIYNKPMPLFLFTIGFFPGVLWLLYFLSRDRVNPEPPGVIAFTFGLGMLSFLPAVWLELAGFSLLSSLGLYQDSTPYWWQSFAESIFLIGPVEELIKWLPAFLYAYFNPAFDEPLDGIIYCLASALGFAAVENIKYMENTGAQIILIRGALANLGHAFFAALAGFGLGKAKFSTNNKAPWIIGGLLVASFAHGLYDFIVSMIDSTPLRLISLIGFVAVLGYITNHAVRRSTNDSPFNKSRSGKLQRCPNCNEYVPYNEGICMRCGCNLPAKITTNKP